MKVAALTGGSGHIGFNVAALLLSKGYRVVLLGRKENQNVEMLKQGGALSHICDLFDETAFGDKLVGCDVLFHCAAENTTATDDRQRVLRNTNGLAVSVISAAVNARVPTIVYTSSVVVLGRSTRRDRLLNEMSRIHSGESPYVEGKLQSELFVQQLVSESNVDIRRVYPCWVVGHGDIRGTPPHRMIEAAYVKGARAYFDGGISVADVSDIAQGHVAAYEVGLRGGAYVLGGDNITFKEFYSTISTLSRRPMPFIGLPKWAICLGASVLKRVCGAIGKTSPIDPAYARAVIGAYSWYDSTKAKTELGYRIRPARESICGAVAEIVGRRAGTQFLGVKRSAVAIAGSTPPGGVLLITGVPGWLGNRMVDILINGDRLGRYASDRKVRLLVEERYRGLLRLSDNFEIVYGDVTRRESLSGAFRDVVAVFHIAGAIYPQRIRTLYEVNYSGTRNVVDECIAQGVRRLIYMSTDSVCGKARRGVRILDESSPPTPYKNYGRSKYLAEKYIFEKTREGVLDGTALRGFWFFGPFAPPRQIGFLNMFRWPRQVVFGNGRNLRSISHVDDTISAFFEAENNRATVGNWYWIGGERMDITVDEIYRLIAEEMHVPYRPLYVPKLLCRLLGMADSLLGMFGYLHPTIHAAAKFDFDIAGNISKARRDFGYDPKVTLNEAVRELVELGRH